VVAAHATTTSGPCDAADGYAFDRPGTARLAALASGGVAGSLPDSNVDAAARRMATAVPLRSPIALSITTATYHTVSWTTQVAEGRESICRDRCFAYYLRELPSRFPNGSATT